jgi:hypothetical protein
MLRTFIEDIICGYNILYQHNIGLIKMLAIRTNIIIVVVAQRRDFIGINPNNCY